MDLSRKPDVPPAAAPGSDAALISLRPEQNGDAPFLFEVYASTREEELALTNWDAATRRMFLDMQFAAMNRGYAGMFPTGEFSVICEHGQPIGRLVLYRSAEEIRVVDLALLPAHRNRGIGTLLMRRVCDEAGRAGKPVRLSVLKTNRAAHWYARLGFHKIGEAGFHDELEWRAGEGSVSV